MPSRELFMKFDKLPKILSLKRLERYGLPIPQTLFIFNFNKQEKEIDEFLRGKKEVSIRSDKMNDSQFCPSIPRCLAGKAKSLCKKINQQGYVVILHEYFPLKKGRIACGHILTLKGHILFELVDRGAVSRLDREGEVKEIVKLRKKDLTEAEHFGKRTAKRSALKKVALLVKNIPCFKILDFTLMESGPYFYQIQDDETASRLS
jgi:hypothetical protein